MRAALVGGRRAGRRVLRTYHRHPMNATLWVALAVTGLALVIVIIAALRSRQLSATALVRLDELARSNERLERELRGAVESAAAASRLETGARLSDLHGGLTQQMTGMAGMQGQQLLGFGEQVSKVSEAANTAARANREESAQQLKDFATLMQQQLAELNRSIHGNVNTCFTRSDLWSGRYGAGVGAGGCEHCPRR